MNRGKSAIDGPQEAQPKSGEAAVTGAWRASVAVKALAETGIRAAGACPPISVGGRREL
jgi:hypothetical protein